MHLPRPRSHATTHDPEYGKLFDRIYGLLRDEVMQAMVSEAMAMSDQPAAEQPAVEAPVRPGRRKPGSTTRSCSAGAR